MTYPRISKYKDQKDKGEKLLDYFQLYNASTTPNKPSLKPKVKYSLKKKESTKRKTKKKLNF
jgi:hypothetical protein